MKKILEYINFLKENHYYPKVGEITGSSSDPEVTIQGKKFLMFCSSNYLGLANHPEIKKTVKEAINTYGIGVNGSRLVSGTLDVHKRLERTIAEYKNKSDAITFPTGFMANTGTIPALINVPSISSLLQNSVKKELPTEESVIISDELNHASIIDGAKLAKARIEIYKHTELYHLEDILKQNKNNRKLIVTDSIFSMEGDIAPLPEIIGIAQKYSTLVMVDDAHGTGVLGNTGRGALEHFGIKNNTIIQMGTFSKSFGSLGGFVVGDNDLVDYLRISARTYMFSGAFPGALAAGIIKAIEIAKTEPERRKKLWNNTHYLINNLKKLGFNTFNTQTPIIPILIGPEEKAIKVYSELYSRGILAPAMRWPAVPRGQSRIRVTLMATHEKEHLDKLIEVLSLTCRKYNII